MRALLANLERRLGFQGVILLGVFGSVLTLSVVLFLFTQRFTGEVFELAVNPELRALAEKPLTLYPEILRARREAHALRTELLAREPVLIRTPFDPAQARARLETVCDDDPYLRRVQVVRPDAPELSVPCPRPPDKGPLRLQTRELPLPDGGRLRATFGMPEAVFNAFEEAQTTARHYRHLLEQKEAVRIAYQRAFALVLGAWLLLGGLFAVSLTRRTTRRLRALAAATQRLSRGEMDVQVRVEGTDELGDLARAFNTMVRELAERREQIVYLERVSSWQGIARRLAHEIKNPLTPIQLAMQELCSAYPGNDDAFGRLLKEVDEIVREEVQTLRRLVTAFSEFAKLPDVVCTPARLGQVLQDYLRAHPDLAARAEIHLTLPREDPLVSIDRALFGRVLTNLVQNAIEAAGPAPPHPPHIELRLDVQGTEARLTVQDDGPGVEAEHPSQIFDPYFTTKATGTGLGLAISRKIVLQHGGELALRPSPEGGATFEIRLPLASSEEDTGPAPRSQARV